MQVPSPVSGFASQHISPASQLSSPLRPLPIMSHSSPSALVPWISRQTVESHELLPISHATEVHFSPSWHSVGFQMSHSVPQLIPPASGTKEEPVVLVGSVSVPPVEVEGSVSVSVGSVSVASVVLLVAFVSVGSSVVAPLPVPSSDSSPAPVVSPSSPQPEASGSARQVARKNPREERDRSTPQLSGNVGICAMLGLRRMRTFEFGRIDALFAWISRSEASGSRCVGGALDDVVFGSHDPLGPRLHSGYFSCNSTRA